MKKRLAALIMLIVMVMTVVACGNSNNKNENSQETTTNANTEVKETDKDRAGVTLKLSQSTPSTNPVSEALTYFSDELYDMSDGSIKVDVYFDAALGSEPESIEGLSLGTIQMTRVATANMASFVPELEVFNLPFLFRDEQHYWNVLNGEVGDYIKEKFEENGYKLLTFYEDGSRNVYHIDKFIETADDFKGVKIRTMTSTLITEAFEAIGASPTPMNFGELYTALQQGIVDAGENNFSTIYTSAQYEVAPYITITEHYRMPSVLIMGLEQWNGLSEEQKELIQTAADASREWEIPHFIEADNEYKEMLIEAGVNIQDFPEEEREILLEKLSEVYEECNEMVGNDLVNKIIETE